MGSQDGNFNGSQHADPATLHSKTNQQAASNQAANNNAAGQAAVNDSIGPMQPVAAQGQNNMAAAGAPNAATGGKKPVQKSRCIGHYMIGKNIGEGTFGKVKAGTHNITGEKVSSHLL